MNKGAVFGRVFEPPVGAAFLYGIEHNMKMIITVDCKMKLNT